MVSSPTPPAAPDPMATAQAQGQMNKDTAIATQNMNAINQVTPQGSLTYSTIGQNADGTPIKQATTTLSPVENYLFDLNQQTRGAIGRTGLEQSQKIGQLLGTPVGLSPLDLSNNATESRLMELGRSRLDPMLAQRRAQTETDLINRGITRGTEAYDNAMKSVTQGENDAYNQLLLSGHGQAVNEALTAHNQGNQDILTARNQPINEITALMSGGQVSQPNFVNTPQTQVANTDYLGAVNNATNAQIANYQGQVSQNNAMIGGLAGLGGAIGGAALGGWGGGGGMFGSKKPWFMGS